MYKYDVETEDWEVIANLEIGREDCGYAYVDPDVLVCN